LELTVQNTLSEPFIEAINIAKNFSGFVKVITVYRKGMDKKQKKSSKKQNNPLKERKSIIVHYQFSDLILQEP